MHAAAVARKAGEPLVIEEVVVAPPKSYEVRIRTICSSLCNTDIAFWEKKVCMNPAMFHHNFTIYKHTMHIGKH